MCAVTVFAQVFLLVKKLFHDLDCCIYSLAIIFYVFKILALFDAIDTVSVDRIVQYVAGLQQPDGSFYGDKWGEVDTRFSFCAVACLALLVSIHYMIKSS